MSWEITPVLSELRRQLANLNVKFISKFAENVTVTAIGIIEYHFCRILLEQLSKLTS